MLMGSCFLLIFVIEIWVLVIIVSKSTVNEFNWILLCFARSVVYATSQGRLVLLKSFFARLSRALSIQRYRSSTTRRNISADHTPPTRPIGGIPKKNLFALNMEPMKLSSGMRQLRQLNLIGWEVGELNCFRLVRGLFRSKRLKRLVRGVGKMRIYRGVGQSPE